MRRFLDAVQLGGGHKKTLEQWFEPYLRMDDRDVEAHHGPFYEVLAARLARNLRGQGYHSPLMQDRTFENIKQTLMSIPETRKNGDAERSEETCKSPS
jgi:hypothetical protein